MEPVATYTRGGETLRIYVDEHAESPRQWDNLGTMVCFHGRHVLGDAHKLDIEAAKAIEADKSVISLPLYLYDHSGITMRTTPFSCPWDSGKVGFIYVTKAKALKEMGWKTLTSKRVAKLLEVLKSEVATYDQFLTGDVYGFTLHKDGEETDSCWGFYGADPATNGMADHVGPGWTPADRKTA